jgi:integral membrane protein
VSAAPPVDEKPWERASRRRAQAGRTHIKSIRFLRTMAVAEATAFLLLLTAAVVHGLDHRTFGTELFIMGNVHGAVFTTYVISIFIFRAKVGWGPVMLLLVLLAGFLPGGGLMVERWALAAPGREERSGRNQERSGGDPSS